ncbi:LysR family transcriptional regulator ArgP [Kribbella sp. VKM Ac-2568]|uniref:LysR family transcriptional regulator ArgP n=1 Tax=Kribbella sp. VKM Ac-2568 TaxID=2512219 RepID=UPI001049E352|nr:LysR family transcriptional regulator ArgP [Kribbella sp. VKM Ac-2568]TCM45933.1 LysR family transcriptional regulator (chromosome initiation inhibitor) [Kribbella sp. VKM Ac-2568]
MQIDAAQLDTFAAVIDEGSFDAAARRLQVTPSAVSQRIKALESHLGQVLIQRTKPARSTDAGEALLRLARQVSLLESEAIAAVKGKAEGLRLPIAVNADSLNGWFLPALLAVPTELVTAFDLRQEDQDHSAELLRNGTVLAAVTADPRPVQGCRIRALGKMRYLSTASPEFAERWLTGRPLPEALAVAPMMVFNPKDMLQHRLIRKVTRRRLDPPVHSIPAPGPFVRAIRLGLGWGMIEEEVVEQDLAAGRLVEVAQGKYVDVPLYWQHWKLESAVLTALTTAVLQAAHSGLRTS